MKPIWKTQVAEERHRLARWAKSIGGGAIALTCLLPHAQALAGNDANFVLYNHHTEEKGETEVNAFSDFSRGAAGDPRYWAQLIEIERAVTDRWTAAVYFDWQKTDGEPYHFGGWRIENRYRLFEYGAFLNPVLYVEYENLKPARK